MIISIDPDLVKSGVAVIQDGKIQALLALSFYDLTQFIEQHPTALYVIENVEYDKTTYIRPGLSRAAMNKVAQNVGQVKGTHRQILNWLEAKGCQVKRVAPLKGPVKQRAKKDAKYFNKITGWTGSSNEDKRDAALLGLFFQT